VRVCLCAWVFIDLFACMCAWVLGCACVRGYLGVRVCVGFWACVCAWVLGFLLICVPVCVRGSVCAWMCVGTWVRECVLNFIHGKLFIKVHRHIVSCQLILYSPFLLKIFEMLPKDLRKVPIVHIKNGDVCLCVIANGRSLVLVPC